MRHIFIVNPAAGKRQAPLGFIPIIEKRFDGGDFEIYLTKGGGDASEFVRKTAQSGEPSRFYSCGGDGTLSEVASGAYGFENAEVACVPLGSGNDFIKTFGGAERFLDIDSQVRAEAMPIDLIRAGDRIAINICSMGLDAEVGANQSRFKRLPLVSGPMAYNMSLAYCFFKKVRHRFEICIDEHEPICGEFIFALAGNARYYGGGFCGAPEAVPNDGLLDFVLVGAVSRPRILGLISKFKAGRILEEADICQFYRGKRMTVKAETPSAINADGECVIQTEETFEVIPNGLRFVVP